MSGGGGRADPAQARRALHGHGLLLRRPARAGQPRGDGSLGRAVRWLHQVDAIFSPYRADSDVSRLGRGELPLADCAPEVAEVLARCAGISDAHRRLLHRPRPAARSTRPAT